MNTPNNRQIVARLSPEVYKQIEQNCKPADVGTSTTPVQVAFALGQQSVLKYLRENIVVG